MEIVVTPTIYQVTKHVLFFDIEAPLNSTTNLGSINSLEFKRLYLIRTFVTSWKFNIYLIQNIMNFISSQKFSQLLL